MVCHCADILLRQHLARNLGTVSIHINSTKSFSSSNKFNPLNSSAEGTSNGKTAADGSGNTYLI